MGPRHALDVPCLILPVDFGRIVRGGLSEVALPMTAAVVRKQTGVDEHRPSLQPGDHRQAVGVPVHCVGHPIRAHAGRLLAAIEEQVVTVRVPAAAEDPVSARRQGGRGLHGWAGAERPESLEPFRTEEPQRVLVEAPGGILEVTTAEEDRARRLEVPEIPERPMFHPDRLAIIGAAKSRRRPIRLAHRHAERDAFLDGLPDGRRELVS